MSRKKRVAAIITEYWDISHADVFITKMLEVFSINGIRYASSLDIVSMYVDRFPEHDISRSLAAKHGIPMYGTIEETLRCGGADMPIDGILIIGEHGDYPRNEFDQIMYPRRLFFEKCLHTMLEHGRIVPVFTDKGFAIMRDDIEWMYEQVNKYNIPFMSSSSIPFAFQHPAPAPIPGGAPLSQMFGFSWGVDIDRYVYHTMEMLQSYAKRRAYGESGIASVAACEGKEAIRRLLGPDWRDMYETLGGYVNLTDLDAFPHTLDRPVLIQINYADGLKGAILHADKEINQFVSCYRINAGSPVYCTEFRCQWQKPYVHAANFVLEIERFIHTGRCSFPLERSLLTTGATDAAMKALHDNKEIETPHLLVAY